MYHTWKEFKEGKFSVNIPDKETLLKFGEITGDKSRSACANAYIYPDSLGYENGRLHWGELPINVPLSAVKFTLDDFRTQKLAVRWTDAFLNACYAAGMHWSDGGTKAPTAHITYLSCGAFRPNVLEFMNDDGAYYRSQGYTVVDASDFVLPPTKKGYGLSQWTPAAKQPDLVDQMLAGKVLLWCETQPDADELIRQFHAKGAKGSGGVEDGAFHAPCGFSLCRKEVWGWSMSREGFACNHGLPVRDFIAPPVRTFTAVQKGDTTTLTLEMDGKVKHETVKRFHEDADDFLTAVEHGVKKLRGTTAEHKYKVGDVVHVSRSASGVSRDFICQIKEELLGEDELAFLVHNYKGNCDNCVLPHDITGYAEAPVQRKYKVGDRVKADIFGDTRTVTIYYVDMGSTRYPYHADRWCLSEDANGKDTCGNPTECYIIGLALPYRVGDVVCVAKSNLNDGPFIGKITELLDQDYHACQYSIKGLCCYADDVLGLAHPDQSKPYKVGEKLFLRRGWGYNKPFVGKIAEARGADYRVKEPNGMPHWQHNSCIIGRAL